MDTRAPRQGDSRDAAMPWNGHTSLWDRLKAGVRHLGEFATGSGQENGEQLASWWLSPSMSTVPRVRRLTRAWLAAWGHREQVEVAELLVSEIVTNALRHAPGPYRLTLYATDGLLRGEVEDAGTAPLHVRHAQPGDEQGRGLDMINLLACCWGSESTPEGKTVWFELPTSPAGVIHRPHR
ncbi:ATP-binding protein [Nonomuraea sp. NEAU-A123]|uniref:ATP-binding protein n=1 Tax=Nonomuraea sp. NEAU-A123 TaxID=2839649 RepID=UPI001BE4A55B|nr:ATP-binding protein [Nonomuraea sp. NEAU-A123]MBT2226750.1 ATP-binding protein [Nonomuraea sp. NEAU-A123]